MSGHELVVLSVTWEFVKISTILRLTDAIYIGYLLVLDSDIKQSPSLHDFSSPVFRYRGAEAPSSR